jgi:trans-aconitate 2-methyltransferase
MTTSPWKPEQYERFRNERSQPFFDLLSLVEPAPGGRVVDLGCGTGELTRVLHVKTKARLTIGLDNSETMLAKSQQFTGDGLMFERAEIESFHPAQPFDVVFSNAAFQWVDDHATLMPKLVDLVAPGGQLAFQMPANADHVSHLTAREIAHESPFTEAMNGYDRPWPVRAPEWYAEALDDFGFTNLQVRLQVYGHKLSSSLEVVEWVKGTFLHGAACGAARRPKAVLLCVQAHTGPREESGLK